jgi:hypothetical protein
MPGRCTAKSSGKAGMVKKLKKLWIMAPGLREYEFFQSLTNPWLDFPFMEGLRKEHDITLIPSNICNSLITLREGNNAPERYPEGVQPSDGEPDRSNLHNQISYRQPDTMIGMTVFTWPL